MDEANAPRRAHDDASNACYSVASLVGSVLAASSFSLTAPCASTGLSQTLKAEDVSRRVRHLAQGLSALGTGVRDTVTICAPLSIEVVLLELAAHALGCTVAIVDSDGNDVQQNIASTRPKILVCVDDRHPAIGITDTKILVVAVTSTAKLPSHVTSLFALESAASDGEAPPLELPRVHAHDAAMLHVTPGTGGSARVVTASHARVLHAVAALSMTFVADGPILCAVPYSHALFRQLLFWASKHGTPFIATTPTATSMALLQHRPTFCFAPPQPVSALAHAVHADQLSGGVVRTQSFRAARHVHLRTHLLAHKPVLLRLQRRLLDATLVRLRARFGLSRLTHLVCVMAPLPSAEREHLHAIGVEVLAGYALTETFGLVAVERLHARKNETVGQCMPGYQVVASDSQTLLVSSSDAALPDVETGDLGAVSEDNFVQLKGRSDDLQKSAGGKRIFVNRVRSALVAQPGITDAVVVAHGRPFVVALAVVDNEADGDAILQHARAAANRQLAGHESIRAIITVSPFALTPGALTADGRVKPHAVQQHHWSKIEALYASLLSAQ